jgi:death-on-curing protein
MHRLLFQETGGSEGIMDEGLLDSALNAPFQTFDGEDVYKTIPAKAAKLGFLLINNHPFIDGNKRIGTLAMLVFLEINGIEIKCMDDELIKHGLGLAEGKVDTKSLLGWIIEHS